MSIKLKDQVEHVLSSEPYTRNSDADLIVRLYENYFYLGDTISKLRLLDIMKYAEPDLIVRYRRKFNQDGRYLATDEKILEARNKRKKIIKEELGYSIDGEHHIVGANLDKEYNNKLNL